jgi:hypothetical protein
MSDVDRELSRLARATEGIGPRAGFSARVMQAIAREQSFAMLVPRAFRRVAAVAALAAVAAVGFAVFADRDVDETAAAYADVDPENDP